MSEWIVIPNWEKFQHYSDRSPTWIKIYTELNSDPVWLALSAAECGLLTKIWLEYARSRGRLSTKRALSLCAKSARSAHLKALNDAGFIQLSASEPLALTRSREKKRGEASKEASPLREEGASKSPPAVEDGGDFAAPEKKKPKGDEAELYQRAKEYAAEWDGGPSELFDNALDSLERQLHAQLSVGQRSELWDRALARDRARIRDRRPT